MADQHLIDPQNLPTWTAGAFIVALIALVVAVVGIYRTNVILVGTQLEALALNKKIEEMKVPAVAPTPASKVKPAK